MKKILVIEDEETVLDIIYELLISEDFKVITAENGQIGVEKALEHLPDLIVCDVMMPKLDGYEVLQKLHNDTRTKFIPFIFLSAKAAKEDQRQGMNLGADDYLTKPFTREQLLDAVNTRLKKQQSLEIKVQEKLDELRTSLTFMLPHELRTPLQGIITSSELLTDYGDSLEKAEIYEIGQTIKLSSKRLSKLIERFIQYMQVEIAIYNPEQKKALFSGKTDFVTSLISLLIEEKAKECQRLNDIILNLNNNVSLDISEKWLIKIIDELIDNAFKFSREGTPIIVNSTIEDDKFILEISDQGRGIKEENLKKIGAYMQFERQFYEQQGIGLGLTIVKRITELYGGKLEIDSVHNKETTVRVILPLMKVI